MARPKGGYKDVAGKQIPGVTTICGIEGSSKGALIHWAWKQGSDGLDYRDIRDEAGGIGTAVHAAMDYELKKRTYDPDVLLKGLEDPDSPARFANSIKGFRSWRKSFKLKITHVEEPLISEVHRFGGTPDVFPLFNGVRSVLDYKTAKDVYLEQLMQVAAYSILWDENHPDDPVLGGYHVLRVGKEDGSFHHHYYPDLAVPKRMFLRLREHYDDLALVKKGRMSGVLAA